MGSIVFAVMLSTLMDSVKKGLLDKMKDNLVGFYTGYVQVHGEGYWEDKTLDNSFEPILTVMNQVSHNSQVISSVPRLESYVLAASDNLSKGSMLVGIDPENETKVTGLQDKIIAGDYLTVDDQAVLLTEGLADYLKLGVKDTLVVIGQGYHGVSAAGKYPIKGLVKFGSPDLNKGLIYLPLASSQDLFGAENRLTSLVLRLQDNVKSKQIAAEIQAGLSEDYEVMDWQTMLPELDQVIQGEEAENVIFQVVLYMLIAFGIFGTILMMTMERQYEFGVLVAIGMRRLVLSSMVVMENLFLAFTGAMMGILLSIPIVYYLYKVPIPLQGNLAEAYENFGIEPIFYFSVDAVVFYSQGIVIMILAMILAFYPVLKIWKMDPVKAMQG
jgi:ABC-type lipoprotein release transport system permease subunit